MPKKFKLATRDQLQQCGLLSIKNTRTPVRRVSGWFNDHNTAYLRNYDNYLADNFSKYLINDATLLIFNLGPTGAYDLKFEVIIGDQILVPDSQSLYYLHMLAGKFIYGNMLNGEISIDLSAFTLTAIESLGVFIGGRHNYGHFLMDIFSKSFYLDQYETLSYLISEPYQKEIIDYFRAGCTLGINTGQPLAVKVSRLMLLTTPPPSSVWPTYRSFVSSNVDRRKRIYLLKHGGNQRVHNLIELLTTLRNYSFDIVEAQNTPFPKLVEILSSASCIVTLPEASCTNIYFSDTRTNVICLLPTNWAYSERPDMQWALAPFAGASNFTPLLCPSLDQKESPITGKFIVPIDELCKLLTSNL